MDVLTAASVTENRPRIAQPAAGFAGLAVAMLVLNLLDALFTLVFLQLQVAEELNPIMRLAYRGSPIWFVTLKIAVVQVGLLILTSNKGSQLARYALWVGAAVYAAIVGYHLSFLVHLTLT